MKVKQSLVNDKEALKQSIKDDMEVWRIAFKQHMNRRNNKNVRTLKD